jgi:response regulator NasT
MDAMRTKILLINDDPARAAAARRALIDSTNGVFQVESTASCSEALERLTREGAQQKSIAAVLVDLSSPDSRGIDTIDRLLHVLRIPILVLSAPEDQDTPKPAVKHRAQESSAE